MADEKKKSSGGLIALGIGAAVAVGLAAYFLSKKDQVPPPGGGAAATSIIGFAYSCSPGPCATGSIVGVGGQLVDAAGMPIAAASVRVIATNPGGSAAMVATTDQTGRFFLSTPIISQVNFTLRAVFDGDASRGLAGSVSSELSVVQGPTTCETRQFHSGALSFQTSYALDLGDAALITEMTGSWRVGGYGGTALLRAVFDDGSGINLTGCIPAQGVGSFYSVLVNKLSRFVRFQVFVGAPCSAFGFSYVDQVDVTLITCRPGGPSQTCAALGGSCGTADACVRKGGTYHAIGSTDCLQTCCHA